MSEVFVAVSMGSDSDLLTMQATLDVLRQFEIPFEVKVTSAHRTPEATHAYVTDADQRSCAVFVAAAGMAAQIVSTAEPALGERQRNAGAIVEQDARLRKRLKAAA